MRAVGRDGRDESSTWPCPTISAPQVVDLFAIRERPSQLAVEVRELAHPISDWSRSGPSGAQLQLAIAV